MSESQLPEKYNPKTLLGKALVDLDKVQLPEMIEKNLIRSASRLITGLVDIPVAYLKSVERNIGRETEALDIISKSNAEDIVKLNAQDYEFTKSTADYYSLKQFKEASNRRTVLNQVIHDLNENPPSDDCQKEIDEDWLELFSRVAEVRSDEQTIILYSKILAGEIKQPGTFSRKTLNTLSTLSQDTAKAFQYFCASTIHVEFNQVKKTAYAICEILDRERWPLLPKLYTAREWIDDLQENGLVRYDPEFMKYYEDDWIRPNIQIGQSQIEFELKQDSLSNGKLKFACYDFSRTGYELYEITRLNDDEYLSRIRRRYKAWIRTNLKLVVKTS